MGKTIAVEKFEQKGKKEKTLVLRCPLADCARITKKKKKRKEIAHTHLLIIIIFNSTALVLIQKLLSKPRLALNNLLDAGCTRLDSALKWLRLGIEAVCICENVRSYLLTMLIGRLGDIEGPEYTSDRDEQGILSKLFTWADAASLVAKMCQLMKFRKKRTREKLGRRRA